jgi:hypothetical protein
MNDSTALPRVFVVGASLTIGFGPFLEKELEGKMHYDRKRDTPGERAEDDLDFPRGANAGDSSMVLAYMRHRRRHDPIPADILVLNCGLHDMKIDPETGARQVPFEQFEPNLRAILAEAAAMNLKVAWLRITPVVDEIHNTRSKKFYRYAKDVSAYNEIADRVMAEGGAEIIDLHALCATQVPHALTDHIHYDEPARREQAAFIARELLERFG